MREHSNWQRIRKLFGIKGSNDEGKYVPKKKIKPLKKYIPRTGRLEVGVEGDWEPETKNPGNPILEPRAWSY